MRIIDPQGVFDHTYEFDCGLTEHQAHIMGAWLSYNCMQNFIFLKMTNLIVAGGHSQADKEWERRQADPDPHDPYYQPFIVYQIRLMEPDQLAFEMTWRDKIMATHT